MTADYVLTDPPYSLVENVAIVAKGPTGTSVSLKMPSDYDCDGYINSGQAVMVIFSNETPALTASTTVNQQGAYSNQTILHTGFLPDLSTVQIFQQLFGVVSGAINWYTSPCRPHEQQTDIDRDANKCHLVGSYCISKIWGNCTQRKTSYCCFNSKLGQDHPGAGETAASGVRSRRGMGNAGTAQLHRAQPGTVSDARLFQNGFVGIHCRYCSARCSGYCRQDI